jgi:hypothetical protein
MESTLPPTNIMTFMVVISIHNLEIRIPVWTIVPKILDANLSITTGVRNIAGFPQLLGAPYQGIAIIPLGGYIGGFQLSIKIKKKEFVIHSLEHVLLMIQQIMIITSTLELRHAIIQRSTKEALHAQELSHPTQILI